MNTPTLEISTLSSDERELLDLLLKKEGLDLDQLPIPRRTENESCPLSFTQERLWSTGLLADGQPYGNVEMAFHLKGPLNLPALELACNEIVKRHEILRTTFHTFHGEPRQKTQAAKPFSIALDELPMVPKAECFTEAARRATAEARRPFDLACDLLLRVAVWRINEDEALLMFVTHHLATDGWGMRVLLRECAERYNAFASRTMPEIPELPIQYADFAIWQREWLAGDLLESQKAYWKKQLEGAPLELMLSRSRRKLTAPSFLGASESFEIPLDLAEALRTLSRKKGVTLYTTLLACFQALLRCHTQQKDIIVGTTVSNRNRSETEPMIGNFGNNLLLRAGFEDDPSFEQLLERTRDSVLEATAHQDLPLEKLTEGDDEILLPQFQVMFIMRDSALEENLTLSGLKLQSLGLDIGIAALDLKLDITEGLHELSGFIEYKSEMYDSATVSLLVQDFITLAEKITTEPGERISTLGTFIITRPPASDSRINVSDAGHPGSYHSEYLAPRDSLEIKLTNIWEKVLNKRPIGIRDNFFALGHSLLAVRLFAQIGKVLDRNLPLATLFQAPTIEKMAALFREEGWRPAWSPLVAIQPHGTKPPLYCVHGGGGNVLSFQALSKHLGFDQPLYGLQSPGLDGKPPFTRVEDMAEYYLKSIRVFQPKGPYYLEGMSFGGMIAYEMAQQLIRQGEEIGFLGLLDTYPVGYKKILPRASRWRKFEMKLSELLAWPLEEKLRFLKARVNEFKSWFKKSMTGKDGTAAFEEDEDNPVVKAIKRVRAANFAAANSYVPSLYPGRATFFWAQDSFLTCTLKFRIAWDLLVPRGLEMHIIPGTHSGMFEEPYVQVLAAKIKECLEKEKLYQAHQNQNSSEIKQSQRV